MASGDKTFDLYKKGLGRAQNVGSGSEPGYLQRKAAQKRRAQKQLKQRKK